MQAASSYAKRPLIWKPFQNTFYDLVFISSFKQTAMHQKSLKRTQNFRKHAKCQKKY